MDVYDATNERRIKALKAENAKLKRAITDDRLTHVHFRAWAKQLTEEQGYSGSELEWLCNRLANALLADTQESE